MHPLNAWLCVAIGSMCGEMTELWEGKETLRWRKIVNGKSRRNSRTFTIFTCLWLWTKHCTWKVFPRKERQNKCAGCFSSLSYLGPDGCWSHCLHRIFPAHRETALPFAPWLRWCCPGTLKVLHPSHISTLLLSCAAPLLWRSVTHLHVSQWGKLPHYLSSPGLLFGASTGLSPTLDHFTAAFTRKF